MLSDSCAELSRQSSQAGLAKAKATAEAADAEESMRQTGNEQGTRPGLDDKGMEEAAAAELLLTAEGMLQANPGSHNALCAQAEASFSLRLPGRASHAV